MSKAEFVSGIPFVVLGFMGVFQYDASTGRLAYETARTRMERYVELYELHFETILPFCGNDQVLCINYSYCEQKTNTQTPPTGM